MTTHRKAGVTARPGAGVTLRRRVDADLPGCAEVLRAVHDRDGYPLNWPADPAAWLTPPSLRAAWVAEHDGLIVGHVALARPGEDDEAPRRWGDTARAGVVSRLFVSPAARGLGLGAALLARPTAEAAAAGLHPVLDVLATDTAAVALYERLGWRHLGDAAPRWADRAVTVRCYAAPS